MCTEASYSFTATKGTCKDPSYTIDSVQESVTRYKDVSRTGERAPMSAVARQLVSAAIKVDQSSFQSYRSGVSGNNRWGGKSLLNCVVFGRVTGVTGARYVLGDSTKAVSLAKWMEVPESCSARLDEMRAMASTIKTEVLARVECDEQKVTPNSLGLYRLQHSDESGWLLQVDLPGQGEKSHIVPKATASSERCFDDVREVF